MHASPTALVLSSFLDCRNPCYESVTGEHMWKADTQGKNTYIKTVGGGNVACGHLESGRVTSHGSRPGLSPHIDTRQLFATRNKAYEDMSSSSYSTVFFHLVLGGSSIWTCRMVMKASGVKWSYGTLGFFILKSCLGIGKYGRSRPQGNISSWYDYVLFVSTSIALPCMATDLYLRYSYDWRIAILHAVSGLLPVLAYHLKRNKKDEIQCAVVAANAVSVLFVGIIKENYYAIAMAVSYIISYFAIGTTGSIENVPCLDLFLVGMCFYNFFFQESVIS